MNNNTQAPALAFDGISCVFASNEREGERYVAVGDTTLHVAPGEFVSVVGPTGCGKSTLLNVAAGLLAPSSGSVHVFGEPLTGVNSRAGYMFQAEALMPWRSAISNVAAGLEFRGVSQPDAEKAAGEWLKRVGLGGFENRYPHQMSGGMRKRTALAQTLILDPDIILMDEPCSALDPIATTRIEDLMQEIKKDYTIIIVTHNMQQAARVSDRTAFFTTEVNTQSDRRTGVMVEFDLTQKIFSVPSDERTEAYVTGRFG